MLLFYERIVALAVLGEFTVNHAEAIEELVRAAEKLRDSEPWVNQLSAVDVVKQARKELNRSE